MEKKDGGFTLIELLIALAVLSIMAGVLLQSFVVSRRMNTKARKDELLLDAAKRTMEELKGYPFEELEKFLAEGERYSRWPDYDRIRCIESNAWKRKEPEGKPAAEKAEDRMAIQRPDKDRATVLQLNTDIIRRGTGERPIISAEADFWKVQPGR